MSTIRWEQDADGVVVLTLDDPNQSANTMNDAYKASMHATVERLEAEKDSITGVVVSSVLAARPDLVYGARGVLTSRPLEIRSGEVTA